MSIYNGSLAFTRYRIFGPKSKTSIASLSKLLSPYIMPPIKLDGPIKHEAIGWVRPLGLDSEIQSDQGEDWDMSDCHIGKDFLMRVRFEKRKVPNSLAQTLVKQNMINYLAKNGKVMPKTERTQFKNDLMTNLIKRTLPVIQYVDVLWKESENELIVFTNSKSLRARIEQLFYQTFGESLRLSLVKVDGTLTYLNLNDANEAQLEKRLSKIAKIVPSSFSTVL